MIPMGIAATAPIAKIRFKFASIDYVIQCGVWQFNALDVKGGFRERHLRYGVFRCADVVHDAAAGAFEGGMKRQGGSRSRESTWTRLK